MQEIAIFNKTKGRPVALRVAVADSSLTRLVGLIGKRNLDAGEGLLIRPSSGVHTFGMRFSIDVVAFDRDLRVVALWPELKPFRVSAVSLKIKSVLELPAGQIALSQISLGDQMEVVEGASSAAVQV